MDVTQAASIRKRFAASLTANILRSGVSFATSLLLARWLGPEDFGRMAFLLASFMAFKQLLDMASSAAFFTFLSQRQRSRRFIAFYWCWIGIQFLFSLLIVGILLPDSIIDLVWQGEPRVIVVLALVATFMQQNVWSIASQMAEAQRATIRVQRLNTLVVLFHLVVVVTLWLGGQLFIPLVFIALIAEWSVAGWFAARMYGQVDILPTDAESEQETVVSVFLEFWNYCKPFIPYVWLGFLYEFADRWLLQHWGGAIEQAYYAVAQQFAAVALLATTSILRIFWKEIAEARHQGNDEMVRSLYQKVSKGLYFIGALTAGGLLPWTGEIIELLLGTAYSEGRVTMMLMILYPVHQSMGQIGGTMLYATGQTRMQVIIGLVFMATSILVVYFMLAPEHMLIPGFGLASQGLAFKMVIMQLIQVNIMAWFIAKIFGWKFEWTYQLFGLGVAVIAGWTAKLAVGSLITAHVIALMAATGVIYLILVGTAVYMFPWILGIGREDIRQFLIKSSDKVTSRGG